MVILNCLNFFLNLETSTCTSQIGRVALEVPQFDSSVYKSTEHFGFSFAYDTSVVWNNLPDDVHSVTSLAFFQKEIEN